MNEDPRAGGDRDSVGNTSEFAFSVRTGDPAAFQELYDRVAPALYAWTHLRIQRSPAANLDPQDILQETWLRALQGFESYDPARSFRGWILGITKNLLLQGYRRLSYELLRVQGESPSERQLEILSYPDSVTSLSTRLGKDEAMQRFLAYVSELDHDDRMLLLYCGFEEYTCAEAATRLGLLADTVGKRWQALRERIRESGTCRALALEAIV